MSFAILGIGTAVPPHAIEQTDAAQLAMSFCAQAEGQQRVLSALYRRTGVRTRHSVVLEGSTNGAPARQSFYAPAKAADDRGPTTARRMQLYERGAAPLAQAAVRAALDDAGLAPKAVTHLVTVSCSGFSAPGWDIALIDQLGLSSEVARTHIGFMGCHGALNGLRVARALAESQPDACVVVCAVELCSLHHQYGWHPDRIVANALFADGAAAVVGRAARQRAAWQLVASGSTLVPDSTSAMNWRIGDHGFLMSLSSRVPDLVRQNVGRWLARWLDQHGLSIDQIGSWAIHPGGPRILAACAEAAGFAAELLRPSADVLARYGNMSSPTVLFIVQQLRASDAPRPCVVLGFGPGLTVEAALIR